MKLLKISDTNCPVCQYYQGFEAEVCSLLGFEFEEKSLEQVSNNKDHIYLYVVSRLLDNDGYLVVPTFLIEKDYKIVNSFFGSLEMTKIEFQLYLDKWLRKKQI